MTTSLPTFLIRLISNPPPAGEGVHNWMFRTARQLHAHLPFDEIVSLLESCLANCGRPVPYREIVSAVKNSLACAWRPNRKADSAARKWPEVNSEKRDAIVRDGGGLADLWELSPIRLENEPPHTDAIIDRLFPGNPLLCCGKDKYAFDTKTREQWRGELPQMKYLVPSPMSSVTGLTKEGKVSKHTLASTGPRRFLICEFDSGDQDQQAALLIHLAQKAPLVCALHSGGKSMHSWFYVEGLPEGEVHKFFSYAVRLGADPQPWSRTQFVRMPDAKPYNLNKQTVFFLNFKVLTNK